jgi:hypothetical protein
MRKPASGPTLSQLDAYRRAKLGPLYGKFWVAPGMRSPSEFNAQGLWDPLPPKKPLESVRLAQEERLKKAVGAEFQFRADSNGVTSSSQMAATQTAYNNSTSDPRANQRPAFDRDDLEKLLLCLPLKPSQRTFIFEWWRVCGKLFGREIRFFKALDDVAQAAGVCRRTARNYWRELEELRVVEVVKFPKGKQPRRTRTHRLLVEQLIQQQWPEGKCPICRHVHEQGEQCGCAIKYGERQRLCRCRALRRSVTPIRPKSSYSRHSSPAPAQEPAAQPTPVTAAAPVRDGHRRNAVLPGSRADQRLRELRQNIVERMTFLMRREHLSQNDAINVCCTNFGLGREQIWEHLKIVQFGVALESVPKPAPTVPRVDRSLTVRADDPWKKILRALKANVNPHSFETWLGPTRYLGEENGVLYVRIPSSEFHQVGKKYADLISEAINSLGMEYQDVQFEEKE